jgi:hypothetical protein
MDPGRRGNVPRFGGPVTPEALRRFVGRPEQVVGAELLERADGNERGVRVVRLRTGEIEAEVVVDRALDLHAASIRGVPVAWSSPTGVAGPWFAEPHGLGTLRTFFGGLLTTCGLEHTLAPMVDEVPYFGYPGKAGEAFPLHGRVSAVPARLSAHGVELDADIPHVFVEGEVRQATVFGESFTLRRRIEADLGGRELRLRDRVRNAGYAPTPHMILYHINAGWPLVAPGAEVVASVGAPRFATAAAEGADWRAIDPPQPGFVEQVWEHTPTPGPDGRVRAAVLNDDLGDGRAVGLEVAYSSGTLPRLFQWRMLGEGHYVIGLEPGNLPIEGRRVARERSELVVLEPGEARDYELTLRLLYGRDDLTAARARATPVSPATH